ncbi:PspC domain-containing protein [Trichocoleus sp. FACHB-6]|nr:PspC domain-containing protein [Trichocoleus sp. FACHB-832]MBD2063151.1 PspC domain-containing protein [Trichocoleus sp. FACHB-6]
MAEYFRNPSLVQIAFAILTIAGGQDILLYLLMWAIVPQKNIQR